MGTASPMELAGKDLTLLFDMLNVAFFDGELKRPTINIIPSSRDGYISFSPLVEIVVQNKNKYIGELNISTGILELPIANLCAELIHGMCHINNYQNGIKDTSRSQTYHNRRFEKEAKKRGLNVERDPIYGFSNTSPNSSLIKWVTKNNLHDFKIHRNSYHQPVQPVFIKDMTLETNKVKIMSKSNSIRWVCPDCGTIIRSTRPVRVSCTDCGKQFVNEEKRMVI